MKWFSRGIGFVNGALFAYWCDLGSASPDWGLWGKFMVCATLGYTAGYFWNRPQPTTMGQLESERR